MINVDFFNAIAAYFIFIILVLVGSWILSNGKKFDEVYSKPGILRQCPICSHLFFYYREESVCICPVCKSYLKKEEVE